MVLFTISFLNSSDEHDYKRAYSAYTTNNKEKLRQTYKREPGSVLLLAVSKQHKLQ